MQRRRSRMRSTAIAGALAAALPLAGVARASGGAEPEPATPPPSDAAAFWAAFQHEWEQALEDAAGASQAISSARVSCVRSDAELARVRGDVVLHGALRRDDFRASAPGAFEQQVDVPGGEVAAQVGLAIVCIGEPRLENLPDGRFAARMHDLRWVALLDRDRSWWNPKADARLDATLRHEQCHFDLAETLARRLNARAEDESDESAATGETATEAARAFSDRWKGELSAALREFRGIEAQYDRETAHGTIPAKQEEWLARCDRELRETSRHAR